MSTDDCTVGTGFSTDAASGELIHLGLIDGQIVEIKRINLAPVVDVRIQALLPQITADVIVDVMEALEANRSSRELPVAIEFSDGPGASNPDSTAQLLQLDDKPTFVCVEDSDLGAQSMWVIVNDTNGNPQWRELA